MRRLKFISRLWFLMSKAAIAVALFGHFFSNATGFRK